MPGAAAIRVAEPVGQQLQPVGPEADLVNQHVVVCRFVGALEARVAVEEEIELVWRADGPVNHSA